MGDFKTITVSVDTWKRLTRIKVENGFDTLDRVIIELLMEEEWEA